MLKKILKIGAYTLLSIFLLMSLCIWLVSTEKIQNYLVQKATHYLSDKLKTKVEVNHIRLSFFNHFNIEGVYIEDNKKDTLAYIGNLQIRSSEILSNLWNKETPIIKSIQLENGFVNLNRKDSIWNYDFIIDAFSSSNSKSKDTAKLASTKTNKSNQNDGLPIDLKQLKIKNVKFYMDDAWAGTDMHFAVEDLLLEVSQLDLIKKEFLINQIAIDGAQILLNEYQGIRPPRKKVEDTTSWGTPFNPENFKIVLDKLELKNSSFTFLNGDTTAKPNEFDATNLQIKNINVSLGKTEIVADTIFSTIQQLQAEERCGIKINSLTAKVKLSQVQAQLSEMKLETNHSILQDYYEMQYKNFHSFIEYITDVRMIAHLKKSSISSLDIGYFANLINEYPIKVNMDADVNGTVDSLAVTNADIQASNSHFQGDAYSVGLPDIENTHFFAHIKKIHTSGRDLNLLIPQTRVDAIAWNQLSTIDYVGDYEGSINDFHTQGILNTNLGNANLDLGMSFGAKIPEYHGIVKTDNLDLGKLLNEKSIGKINIDGKVEGKGFDLNTLNTKLNATVKKIEVNGSVYQDLTVNGIFSKKKFDGIFVAQDPNLGFNFNGVLDLSGKEPIMNFNSRILRLDLFKMGVTQEPALLSCLANLNFTGSTIDDFLGSAILKNIVIQTKDKNLQIDSINLNSFLENHEKIIHLNSSIADAELKGKFNFSELPNAFQLYLSHYLPQYIPPQKKVINEQFVYSLKVKEACSVLGVFFPLIKNIDGTLVSGVLNTYEKKFSIDAFFPSIAYDNMKVKDVYLVGAGDFSSLDLNINAGNFDYGEETLIPSFQMNTTMANDTAQLEIFTQSISDFVGTTTIKAKGTASNNKFYVSLLPSNINIKDDNWQLYSKHDFIFGEDIIINDFIAESGAQKITITNDENNIKNLMAKIENIDLESITSYIGLKDAKYYGRLSGMVHVLNFKTKPEILADIKTNSELIIDKDTIGVVRVKGGYHTETKLITIDKQTSVDLKNDIATVGGTINLADSNMNLTASLNNTKIGFVNQFIKDFVEDLRGKLTGNIQIAGKLDKPLIKGNLQLRNGNVKVILLGTSYTIDQASVNFDNQKINLSDIIIKDERFGNYTGILKGNITHKNFTNFYLNLKLVSDDLMCLNTHEWDSELFYGYIHAKVNMAIKGYLNDLIMDIDAKPLNGSNYYLPLGTQGDASKFEFVKFREIGHAQQEESKSSDNYLKLTLNIEATPNIETVIVMDKNTGEEIRAKGNGDLKVIVDLGNTMEMYGNYEITEGVYLFKFRGIVNREFKIDEGSKINWTGDPTEAKMNVKAIYELPKSLALYPLVSNTLDPNDKTEVAEAKRTYKTIVPLSLTGSLTNPDIKFDILQPDNRSIGSAGYTKLQQIRNDEKELFHQAGILLLMGDFKASEGVSSSMYSKSAVSTVSDLVSSAVSSEITNQFQSLTGLKNISLGVNYQNLNGGSSLTNREQFSLNVSANLLKDRITVDFSNSVDIGKDAMGTTNSNFNGDFKANFLITPDGRFKANAYRTSNVDIGGAQFTKSGVGLSYKKVFNSFGDLLFNKRKYKTIKNNPNS